MHVVEVRRRNADLATVMAQLRTSLDDQGIEPARFEIAFLPGRETRLGLQFKNQRDEVTFARNFDGEMLDTAAHEAAA